MSFAFFENVRAIKIAVFSLSKLRKACVEVQNLFAFETQGLRYADVAMSSGAAHFFRLANLPSRLRFSRRICSDDVRLERSVL